MDSIKEKRSALGPLNSTVEAYARAVQQSLVGKETFGTPIVRGFDLSGREVCFPIADCMGPNSQIGVARLFLKAMGVVRTVTTMECWAVLRETTSQDRRPPSECEDRTEILWFVAQDSGVPPIGFAYEIKRDTNGMISSFDTLQDLKVGRILKCPEFLDA